MFFRKSRGSSWMAGPATIPEFVISGNTKNGYSDTSLKTPVKIAVDSSTIVLFCYGQSNAIGIGPDTSFVPTSGVENFNIYNGLQYIGKDPLLGCEQAGGDVLQTPGAAWITRLASSMIDSGMATKVIIVNISIGSTTISDWAPGGMLGGRIRYALRIMRQNGLRPNYILQMQGESDAVAGTYSAAYAATNRSIVDEIRKNGASCPVFISKTALINGATTTNMNSVRDGQVSATDDSLGIYIGPDTDSLSVSGGYRQSDGTHLNQSGLIACAAAFLTTIQNWIATH